MLSRQHDGLTSEEDEDFTRNINAVPDDSDHDQEDDFEVYRRVMGVPVPDAQVHELRAALSDAQQAYAEERDKFHRANKELSMLSSSIPAKKRTQILNKTSSVDAQIAKAGRKYAMLYHFWVIPGLFPVGPMPAVDPRSPTRWASDESRTKGALAELYTAVPQDIHETMATYTQFGSVFTKALNQERSNMLGSIKVFAATLFGPLGLDTGLFSGSARKKDNPAFLRFLKKNGDGNYTPLAPILFANPEAMLAADFLKNPILIKIIRIFVFGKSVFSDTNRGHSKARGERQGILSGSEGMIAGAAIITRFLLSHDSELSQVGSQTQIKYLEDYEFYLQRLLKRTPWAIGIMDFYNREVFGKTCTAAASDPNAQGSAPTPRTWEDEMLDKLDNDDPTAAEAPASSPVSRPAEMRQSPSPRRSPSPQAVVASVDINATSRMPVGASPASSSMELSVVAQLGAGVAQMSVSNPGPAIAQAAPAPESRRGPSRRPAAAAPAHPSEAAVPSGPSNGAAAEPSAPRRNTRSGKGKKKN